MLYSLPYLCTCFNQIFCDGKGPPWEGFGPLKCQKCLVSIPPSQIVGNIQTSVFRFLLKNHPSCGIENFHIRQSFEKQKVISLTLYTYAYLLVSQTLKFSKNKGQFFNIHRNSEDLYCAL
jgi:hypothetical protein